jgi:hypothetical protein
MELTHFHTMRTAVQDNAAPASAEELRALEAEVQQTLLATGLFQDVEVAHTDNIDSLVIGMCTFAEDLDEVEVALRLEAMWGSRLSYDFWEAHTLLVDRDQVELEGATRHSLWGHYVTLHIIAQKAPIPVQRVAVG